MNAEAFFVHWSDLEGIQTLDLQNRNLTLYSAKLRGLFRDGLVRAAKLLKLGGACLCVALIAVQR